MLMPVKIFFCYAHEDEQLLNKLKSQLTPLQRQGLIDVWYDRDISAGTDWEQQIKGHLNAAQIILLLISPDFMASDYCYSIEMQRALERDERGEARVIPIILRHVYWQGVLGKLQALPTDARPIKSWPDLDEALYNVTEGIRKVIEEITPKPSPHSPVLSTPSVLQTPPQEAYILNFFKRYEEALAVCEQALRLNPNDAYAFLHKGNALFGLDRNAEALEAYQQAIRLDPNFAVAYYKKGDVLNKLNMKRQSQQAYEKARQLGYSE
jgi:tetratricopeptide (TPR) repeat protein